MALTEQDKQELLNAIKAESQSVDKLETVTTLDGVVSLPAMKGSKVVNVPVSLLEKPAKDAAAEALAAVTTARDAAGYASQSATYASQAANAANAATEAANTATEATRRAIASAENVVTAHESTAVAGRNGATARFDEINAVGPGNVLGSYCYEEGGTICYSTDLKRFLYLFNTEYYLYWESAARPMALYVDSSNNIFKNKIYLLGEVMYVWSS